MQDRVLNVNPQSSSSYFREASAFGNIIDYELILQNRVWSA